MLETSTAHSHTYNEITNQPVSWKTTVDAISSQWAELQPQLTITPDTHYVFVGCGTSLYIAQSAAQCFQEITGYTSLAVPGSEVFLSAKSTVPSRYPVIAFIISRSGTTTEALLAADYLAANRSNVTTIGITCNSDTELTKRTRFSIQLPHAHEESVVMTQSFTSMLIALQYVAASLAGDQMVIDQISSLSTYLQRDIRSFESKAQELGENLNLDHFVYLGLGPNYGLAQEGNLKLKEMTQVHCEAYNPLEFRHGPISTVREGSAIILLAGNRERDYVPSLVTDLKEVGAFVASCSPYPIDGSDMHLLVGKELTDVPRCALYMPFLQYLAYYRAVSLGLNPDQPRNLSQVVKLDE
ncbi:Glutamine--fructose-6-phosphate transaminase (isomerizing) [Thermobaculum terrenum ATCC BAA-798]|uniref:Glutamine--fructose-6-phosphate transaminase (Isomerizing) n=1 Tax=Thermobaculum terrenum (strain ATCC BAA-798 / CCMEE 7001 / YNP1) TaxID=525904 RepID=D1CDQ5_THET1|nr:SIS domain-containing protein [Thermobaculum terrenum]ACZ41061.1 Glutamine--fructose-6-phosphate transaminase (isomerizing) [Thermobaculum terrenum ATCC BAA-798]